MRQKIRVATKLYLGLASSGVGVALPTTSAFGAGEIGLSRSVPKLIFSKSGRFLLLLPDRALRAHDRSKLPYEDGFLSRDPLS